MQSSLHNKRRSFFLWIGAIALAGLSLGGYLLAARLTYRLGFPVDDAWIHQTYARNLAERGEWAFIPGKPSAGSTAPLWSALLAPGYWLRLAPLAWASLLGAASLIGVAWAGARLFGRLAPEQAHRGAWVGVFLLFEWRLVWAAGSGMETLVSALLALLALGACLQKKPPWLAIGALIGLCVWVRPDGVTLLGPALWIIYFNGPAWRARASALLRLAAGVLLLFLPYLVFNYRLAGAWWPNTFFAKQAEYASLQQAPLAQRFLAEAALPLIGAGVALLPGLILFLVRSLQARRWAHLAPPLWAAGYLFLYAWRLPVTYQHGRYVITAMPVYFVCGLAGMAAWLKMNSPAMLPRVVGRAWALILAVTLVAFYFVGARGYGQDVAVIESEMVAAAQWSAQNLPQDALVAAHDIGALGYFAQRDLIDLAGLVSPEVIPFIRDESRLADYLDQRHAQYLVTFPAWYPQLVQRGDLIFQTSGTFSPQLGGENMAVYRWLP